MATGDYIVNTYAHTLSWKALDCLRELAGHGFTDFEVMMYPGHAWPPEMDASARRSMLQFLQANGLRIAAFNQPNIDINLAAATSEMREYTLANMRGVIELAGEWGVPAIVVGPGKVNPLLPAPRDSVTGHLYRSLDQLVPLATQAGTRILLENIPFAFLPDIASLMDAVEAYGAPEIGIVYDLANGAFIREDLTGALKRCGDRLDLVHLSDTTLQLYRHDPIGEGDMDFARKLVELREHGWTRKTVLEVISSQGDPTGGVLQSAARLDAIGWGQTFSA
jgi:L-ribulose-5-phosphate 3-epimerase